MALITSLLLSIFVFGLREKWDGEVCLDECSSGASVCAALDSMKIDVLSGQWAARTVCVSLDSMIRRALSQVDSAYSVFNPGARAIEGGFTAHQLDAQVRGGLRLGNPGKDDDDGERMASAVAGGRVNVRSVEESKRDGQNACSEAEVRVRRAAAAAAAEWRLHSSSAVTSGQT